MSDWRERLYEGSPVWLQNLGVTWYGWRLWRREYGRSFTDALSRHQAMEAWSAEQWREWQGERLRELLRHCHRWVPHYRAVMDERGLRPEDVQRPEDLARLPVLTREEVRRQGERLVAANAGPADRIPGRTSGTTGSPLQFLYDRRVCRLKNVMEWRHKAWAGVRFGDRAAFFLGRLVVPRERRRPPYWRVNRLFRHMFCSTFHLSPDTLPHYLRALRRFAPVVLDGYPSALHIFARFLLRTGQRLEGLRGVFVSAEPLHAHVRADLERAFGCGVFDYYSLAERVGFAGECDRHQGLHVFPDYGVIEILDAEGRPVPPGGSGFLVATALHNSTMPLIRYQIRDLTTWAGRECACGRSFPLMGEVATKVEDVITTPEGRMVPASAITHPFKGLVGVEESQVIQPESDRVIVRLVTDDRFTAAAAETLRAELRRRLGEAVQVDVERVAAIPRTAAGKLRWVVSHVPPPL